MGTGPLTNYSAVCNMKQPWLIDARKESLLILAPALVPVLLVILFQDYFLNSEVSTAWWVLLVLGIDVSHVYSTLFRLYWDKPTFIQHRRLLIVIPLVAFALGFSLHYYDSFVFWRTLAYVAVFHFVRQQYGFMRLYSRKESRNQLHRFIDSLSIYNATLYPLLFWHVHATDKLGWFVKGDFIRLRIESWFPLITAAYLTIMVIYILKESWYLRRGFNIPKNLIIAGTYSSWYVGIVLFQGDLIFTLLNVVAHGIPYMGLIWIYGEKKGTKDFSFTWKGVIVFSTVLLLLAYLEEFFWDGFVWNDHPEIFSTFIQLNVIQSPMILSVVVALLVLPQITHYVLDGFIWRFSKDGPSGLST
jgi:hypothetical protein